MVRLLRWQFTILHVLLISAACCLGTAWLVEHDRRISLQLQVGHLARINNRLTVNAILNGSLTSEQKATALAKYVKLGDELEGLRGWAVIGPRFRCSKTGYGVETVFFGECDLVIECAHGRVIAIGRAGAVGSEWILPKDRRATTNPGSD